MKPVPGTYRDGHVDLDIRVDWLDGSRVAVVPAEDSLGLREADWPDTPQTRAALLAKMDALEPLELTPAEEAEIAAARQAVREASVRGPVVL